MISDEAVEAAAKRMAGARHGLWELTPESKRRVYLRDARLALEAAAPDMQAEAWDEGANAYFDQLSEVAHDWTVVRNPYRSQA